MLYNIITTVAGISMQKVALFNNVESVMISSDHYLLKYTHRCTFAMCSRRFLADDIPDYYRVITVLTN